MLKLMGKKIFYAQNFHLNVSKYNLTRIPRISCVPSKTEVKQGKFVEFIQPVKGCFRET